MAYLQIPSHVCLNFAFFSGYPSFKALGLVPEDPRCQVVILGYSGFANDYGVQNCQRAAAYFSMKCLLPDTTVRGFSKVYLERQMIYGR